MNESEAMDLVTLREIAARCGCSIATVSKALNGMPDIKPATAEQIRAVASQMGYLPNAAARTLKTSHSKTIGMFSFLRNECIWRHDHFSRIAEGVQRVMCARGYDIAPIDSSCEMLMNSYVDYCRYRNYDGLIILSAGMLDQRMRALVESDYPLVSIDFSFHHRSCVLSDNVQGVCELMEYIYSMGHRRIAFIHGDDTSVTSNRVASFYTMCDRYNLPVPDGYLRAGHYRDTLECEMLTNELMALPNPPTCILFPDDFASIGGLNALSKLGLHVPRDVSCVGYDGIDLTQLTFPRLTTFAQDGLGIGQNAAQLLLEAIEKPKYYIPRQVILPGKFIMGESVRNINIGMTA